MFEQCKNWTIIGQHYVYGSTWHEMKRKLKKGMLNSLLLLASMYLILINMQVFDSPTNEPSLSTDSITIITCFS